MERRLAAILAADVVGYTRLMGVDEAGTLRRLKALREKILDPLVSEHHGRIVKLMGDGLLIEFGSAVDSVTCALAWQERVAEHESQFEGDAALLFRIGINLGDVIAENGDIHGDGVNIASRLEGLAEPGTVCISDDIYRHVRGKIEVHFEDIGEQSLKNVAEPIRVHCISSGKPATAPPAVVVEPLPLPDKPSIAVLPFDNLSDDREQQYLVDGIVEDIITELSRFKELFVIARNSTFAYKGQTIDVRLVAAELGVRYIAEGSIRRAGNRVRVVAQLLDSESGSHVWAEKYDRGLEDIFELQEEITRQVVNGIAPQIEIAEVSRSHRLSGENLSAYEQALKARAKFYEAIDAGSPDLMNEAIAIAKAALVIDPRNSHTLDALGNAYLVKYLFRWGDNLTDDLSLGEDVANRFVSIDPAPLNPAVAW